MQRGERYRERDGRLVRTTGQPFSGWTVRGTLVVLGLVLGAAERAGRIPANPVRRLERRERPKVARSEFPSLDREAIGRLVAATPSRYRLIVAVSVITGVRQSEALALRWQDVDTKAGEILVRWQLDRKGGLVELKTDAARREIPIPPSLVRALIEHRLASDHSDDDHFVFCTATGGPFHRRNMVRRGLEPAITEAALPHLRWHDLRHLAASALIAQSEGDVDFVSRVLGHASATVTLGVYGHMFERLERSDRMRGKMEAAYGAML
jgi:integrase